MRILVLFGGESVEHEISVISANQVINAMKVNYSVLPLYIGKDNKFYYREDLDCLEIYKNISKITCNKNEVKICRKNKKNYLKFKGIRKKKFFDFAFIVVHGKGMEDSTLLSYLKFKKIPVIADSLSFYALAQNKALTKRVLNDLEIKNSSFIELYKGESISGLEFPVIIKPNTLGSSIGISKAGNEEELEMALQEAFKYDKKVIVEEFLEDSKEFNISVVEKDGEILTSNIEEVVKDSDVLDYSQKYEGHKNVKGMASSKREVPAKISENIKTEIEEIAKKIYYHFEAKGVIRIDFLYNKGKVYVNEINSIPGSYAFYLWKGKMDFVELLDTVIDTGKKDIFKENKIIKSIDKMDIFKNYKNNSSKFK